MKRILLILVIAAALAGCTEKGVTNDGYINCPEDLINARFCTANYDPVCGEDGETYSNACVACSSVLKYKIGECE